MAIDLLWIPLGAGGSGLVRANGRIYERIAAWRERRRPLALVHTALRVHADDGEWIVETMWPSPAGDPAERGVVVQGPVFLRTLGRVRLFRYEVRRWKDGDLPDAQEAVGGPMRVAADPQSARRLLELAAAVPVLTWGRRLPRRGPGSNQPPDQRAAPGPPARSGGDELRIANCAHPPPPSLPSAREMWNSNSVVSWLLTRAGLPIDEISPPEGYRAPGWDAGVAIARRSG